MTEYERRPLGDLIRCLDEQRRPVKASERRAGPYPYYGASGVVDHVDDFLFDGPHLLIAEDGENLRSRKTPIAFMASGKFWVNNHAHIVLGNERADTRFLAYAVQSADVSGYLTGSTQPKLTQQSLLRLPVIAPPLSTQRAIVEVLGALDDRVESNRRCNQLSSEIAQCEFEAELSEHGVAWDVAWPQKSLGEVLDVIETGTRPRGGVAGIASGVPSIGAESVVEAGHFDFGKMKLVPREFFDAMTRGRLQDRDVLLYKDGGRPGEFEPHVSMVGEGFPFAECAINEHVYRLRVAPPFSQDFLYFWLRSDRMSEEMRRRGTGVAIPGLNSTNVKALPIIVPDGARLARAQALAEPLMTDILKKAKQSRTIVELRDALLPELFSGRLPVDEAATMTDAVT